MVHSLLLMLAFLLFLIAGFVSPLMTAPQPPYNPWWSRLVCWGLAAWSFSELLVAWVK